MSALRKHELPQFVWCVVHHCRSVMRTQHAVCYQMALPRTYYYDLCCPLIVRHSAVSICVMQLQKLRNWCFVQHALLAATAAGYDCIALTLSWHEATFVRGSTAAQGHGCLSKAPVSVLQRCACAVCCAVPASTCAETRCLVSRFLL